MKANKGEEIEKKDEGKKEERKRRKKGEKKKEKKHKETENRYRDGVGLRLIEKPRQPGPMELKSLLQDIANEENFFEWTCRVIHG